MLTRRSIVGAAALTGIAGAVMGSGSASFAWSKDTLKARAKRGGRNFGFALNASSLCRNAALQRLVTEEADMVVAGFEMKWPVIEPARAVFDFERAQSVVDYAGRQGLRLRGHAAIWYRGVPKWAAPTLAGPGAIEAMTLHVGQIVRQWRGRICEWDVVNEAIEPKDGLPGDLRRAPFGRDMGIDWIEQCFRAAHEADPAAKLFYNEYGIETNTPADERKRAAVLALFAELKRRNVPIHGLGIQSHLAVIRPFDAAIFRAFLRDIAAMGLEIRLTEFDVSGHKLYGPEMWRDMRIAHYAKTYLDTAFDEPAVVGLICWGVHNGESWLQSERWARPVGAPALRPLPYDDALKPTPLWSAVAMAFDGAPRRSPGAVA